MYQEKERGNMSKKSELIKLFSEFKDRYTSLQSNVSEVKKSSFYTEEGKQQSINKLLEDFQPTIQLYHDKAIAYIDAGLVALLEKWKANSTGKLSDVGYQMGLANTLKIIESDVIHDVEDIKNIVNTYKDDYNAMATIRNLLSKNDRAMEFMGVIPDDKRDYNKQLLGQLRNNVDKYINITISNGTRYYESFLGDSAVLLAMDDFIGFISSRFTDDLSLIQ